MGSDPAEDKDKRGNPRLPVGFPAEFRSGRKSGTGLVRDISDQGAWIDRPSRALSNGSRLSLRLRLGHDTMEMEGRVVRAKRGGFAVQFDAPNPRLQQLLQVALTRQAFGRR